MRTINIDNKNNEKKLINILQKDDSSEISKGNPSLAPIREFLRLGVRICSLNLFMTPISYPH